MKFKDIKDKSEDELKKMLSEHRIKLSGLAIQRSNNSLKDTSAIRKIKKDIARILTIMHKSHYNSLGHE